MSALPAIGLLRRFVPPAIRSAVRRAYERRTLDDALRHIGRLPAGEVPSRQLLDDLQNGWANDGMAGRTDYLLEVCRHAMSARGPILECGSGLTTLLIGLFAGRRGVATCTLEHMAEWRDLVARALTRHHIPGRLELAPLTDYGSFTWYRLPERLPQAFALVVCDAPPSDTPGGRYGLMPLLRQRLARGATVLLDDAERAGEREVLARWAEEDGAETTVRETASGTFAIVSYQSAVDA
jgi:hypothetical protein